MSKKDMYKRNRKNLATFSQSTITLIVAITIVTTILIVGSSDVSAQNISQNTTSTSEVYSKQKVAPNWTGTIDMGSTIGEALKSKVTVNIIDAITTAQNSVGPNSMVKSAELTEAYGYLVYKMKVVDENMKKYKVLVDPGNGNVLVKKETTGYDHDGGKYEDKSKKYGDHEKMRYGMK
jgi:hypothetical protein